MAILKINHWVKLFKNKQSRLIAVTIIIGIILRLIFALFFNHAFDFFNIIALVKSIADTGNLTEGFIVIKNSINHNVQLYGKIYYQIAAFWMFLLEKAGLIDIKYIFDNQPYHQSSSYMIGFLHWGPYLYQLVAIKLIQFLYDFIYLFFLTKIARLISAKNTKAHLLTTLFWALNPLPIFSSYALFQSDLAMVSFLVGGVYFSLKSLKTDLNKIVSFNKLAAFIFFAIGGVIKQVPLLFVPIFLILLSNNLISLLINGVAFAVSYLVILQPFSRDVYLTKKFFINSQESLALFNFNLNGTSVFLLLYIILFITLIIYKDKIAFSSINLIKISTALLAIIYLSEESSFLYTQFNIWIMPFLFFIALKEPIYGLFLFAPLLGFYKRAIADTDVMIGSLAITLGTPLHQTLSYEELISNYINPAIFYSLINTGLAFSYLLLIGLMVNKTPAIIIAVKNRLKAITQVINLRKIILIIFFAYLSIIAFDYWLRSRYIRLTNFEYKKEAKEIKLVERPVTVDIDNPRKVKISGFQIEIFTKERVTNNFVTFAISDKTTGKQLFKQDIHNLNFLNSKNNVFKLYLPQPIDNQKFRLVISTSKSNANIFLKEGIIINKSGDEDFFNGYSRYYKNPPVHFRYIDKPIVLNVIGWYEKKDVFNQLKQHFLIKPSFFKFYGALIISLAFVALGLHLWPVK